jgi:hypothetical protein
MGLGEAGAAAAGEATAAVAAAYEAAQPRRDDLGDVADADGTVGVVDAHVLDAPVAAAAPDRLDRQGQAAGGLAGGVVVAVDDI